MPVVLPVSASADLFDTGHDWTPAPYHDPQQSRSSQLARILVVDDEPLVRRMLTRFLLEEGYQVIEAANGSEALKIVQRDDEALDLVITDVKMPIMDGRELGRLLNARHPELPVLYISGYSVDAAVGFGLAGEPVPFVRKPFEPDGLLRKIADMLRDRGA